MSPDPSEATPAASSIARLHIPVWGWEYQEAAQPTMTQIGKSHARTATSGENVFVFVVVVLLSSGAGGLFTTRFWYLGLPLALLVFWILIGWLGAPREEVETAEWFPIESIGGANRTDVFGGTPEEWRALIATHGASRLSSGSAVVVMDYIHQDVGSGLLQLAATAGFGTSIVTFPEGMNQVDLLADMSAEAVADVLANAIHSIRPNARDENLRIVDAELLHTVTSRLGKPITFPRLLAGLRVLEQTWSPESDTPLSDTELHAISGEVDFIGRSDRVQDELIFLRAVLGPLARAAGQTSAPSHLRWKRQELTLLRMADSSGRRAETERLLLQALIQLLRCGRAVTSPAVLILAGADRLEASAVEELARGARSAGIHLVLMFEHLRELGQKLVGGSDSATIIMRLGNTEEAHAAAEFIGREYRFVLSQQSRELGETYSKGGSSTRGQDQSSWSTASSTNQGETLSRVYEFQVEPKDIQTLGPTSFILAQSIGHDRRLIAGQCHPDIADYDRVALQPE